MKFGNIKKVAKVILDEYKKRGTAMRVAFRKSHPTYGMWYGAKAVDLGFDSINIPIVIGCYGGGSYSIVDMSEDEVEFLGFNIISAIKKSLDIEDENTKFEIVANGEWRREDKEV